MKIYLMRHFKVDFEWDKTYTSNEFKIARKKYDAAGIINQQVAFKGAVDQVYISELRRSKLTYKALGIDKQTYESNLINEVPLVPFIKTGIKLPTAVWKIMGRIQWLLNIKRQPEVRRDTLKKIEIFIKQLEEEKKDSLIIGHGFYFSQLKRKLIKKKYVGNAKNFYENGEVIKFIKPLTKAV